jgi:hypothetical protein
MVRGAPRHRELVTEDRELGLALHFAAASANDELEVAQNAR